MLYLCVKLSLTFLIYLIVPIVLPLLLGVGLCRWIISTVVIRFDSDITHILTSRSSIAATDDIYEGTPTMTLICVMTLEGTIDISKFAEHFESRVVLKRDCNNNLLRPELRQYITKKFGFSFWKNETNFDVCDHVKLYDGKYVKDFTGTWVRPEMILEVGGELMVTSFKRKMSPWEVHLVHNFMDDTSCLGAIPSTAVILKLHHSLGDGISFTNSLNDLMNQPPIEACESSCLSQLGDLARILIMGPYSIVSQSLESIDPNTWRSKTKKLTYNFGLSSKIPLEEIKQIRKLYGVSFTTVILTAVTGALQKFMAQAGYPVPDYIHCPVSHPVKGHPQRKMRNHSTQCIAKLPVSLPDPVRRIEEIETYLHKSRNSAFPLATFQGASLFGLLFWWLIKPFAIYNVATLGTSLLQGPARIVSYNQHSLRSLQFILCLFRGSCAIGFSTVSYGDALQFIFNIDEALVPKSTLPASILVNHFIEELEILKQIRISKDFEI